MSNIVAIAQKELKTYFATPIGYTLVGAFTLLFGFFFYSILWYFERQSMQMAQMGMMGEAPTMNINQQLISPAFMNVSVILLLTMPLVTMRLYAEEKRSGTIELLLTSPVTDFQIVMGKFLGSMALYTLMLAVTLVHIALLFAFGNPEWRPIASGYLGLLLMGGCFIAVGLFVSSLTRNQIVAGMATFGVFLLLWVINWIAPSVTTPWVQNLLNYLSFTEHLNDFVAGVVDTAHLTYYVSFIAFGLFLTMRSVDTERWRG